MKMTIDLLKCQRKKIIEKYKEIEPKVYDRMVKDFENNLKKIHYPLSPYSKPTVREE